MSRSAAPVVRDASPAVVWKGPAKLRRHIVPIASLEPWPGNPRRHDLPTIQASLREFGQYREIVVQASSRRIIAGHGTTEAAKLEGWTHIAASFIDVADEAVRILLVDNRANDLASYDEGALASMLRTLPKFDATGFNAGDLAALLASIAGQAGKTDPDALPAPPTPRIKPGELWSLGPHRLYCGDSSDPSTLQGLLGSTLKVDLLWTDPPYGVGYEGGHGHPRRRIMNDALKPEALQVLLTAALRNAASVLKPGGAYYISGPAGADLMLVFLQAVAASGLPLRHCIVWAKQSLVLGRADYHYQHEPILAGAVPLAGRSDGSNGAAAAHDASSGSAEPLEHDPVLYGWLGGDKHEFVGGRKQSTVWQIPRPTRSPLHPTQKPVELVERAIRNSTRIGGCVLDLFAGSGTTLIAAHRVQRTAYLVELDPVNCDVIARRFQEFSGGQLPVNVDTGEEVSFAG